MLTSYPYVINSLTTPRSTVTVIVTVTKGSTTYTSTSLSTSSYITSTKTSTTTSKSPTTTSSSDPNVTKCPVPLYYQCGGANWDGCKKGCESGATCLSQNGNWSSCSSERLQRLLTRYPLWQNSTTNALLHPPVHPPVYLPLALILRWLSSSMKWAFGQMRQHLAPGVWTIRWMVKVEWGRGGAYLIQYTHFLWVSTL